MTAQSAVPVSFTIDWLSHNLTVWQEVLAPYKDRPAQVLEIGSFEGRSAVFFLEFLPLCTLTCIDTFEGGEEHRVEGRPFGTMSEVEARFDQNVASFDKRVHKLKGHSHDRLDELNRDCGSFDVIYVDGDHHAASTLLDARLAWKVLQPGGVMILDDYKWKPELPESQKPRLGIDEFLMSIAGEFELLHREYQVIIKRKIRLARPEVSQFPLPELTLGGRSLDALAMGALSPPLVSFVLINWNYRDYVGQAIESVKRQDYPFFECLIIDNGSDDDSVDVVRGRIEGDARFRLHRFDRNMGQLGAAIWSLNEIRGRFVTFVDADDVLFPNFASTHLQVHLALPRSVSLTSSTVTEMNTQGELISSRYGHIDLSGRHTQKGLRQAGQVVRFPEVSNEEYASLAGHVGIVPRWVAGWHWGPGTSNMFRKSILDLVRIGDGSEPIMRAADSHFNHICHALTGSALIDLPLSGYRIHSSNYFARLENIDGLSKGSKEKMDGFQAELIATSEVLLENADKFGWLLGKEYWDVVDHCVGSGDGISLRRYRTREAQQAFMRHAEALRHALGERKFCSEIGSRFSYSRARKIIRKGLGGIMPARYTARLALQGGTRQIRAMRRALKLGKRRR